MIDLLYSFKAVVKVRRSSKPLAPQTQLFQESIAEYNKSVHQANWRVLGVVKKALESLYKSPEEVVQLIVTHYNKYRHEQSGPPKHIAEHASQMRMCPALGTNSIECNCTLPPPPLSSCDRPKPRGGHLCSRRPKAKFGSGVQRSVAGHHGRHGPGQHRFHAEGHQRL